MKRHPPISSITVSSHHFHHSPQIMSSSTQSTSSASVTSNSSTRRECLHAHWVACHDAHPSEHRSLMSPSSQSPALSHFTPLSAITLHLPLQFSHSPTMANGVTPVLFSAAGGLSDGPLLHHPLATHMVLRYCRNVRPTWVKFDSKDTKESGVVFRGSEY